MLKNSTYCIIRVGDDLCALGVALVGEVLPATPPTVIPRCPPAVRGLINLRGQAVAVVDVATVLDLPPTAQPPTQYLLLVDGRTPLAALPVQGVVGVLTLHQRREPDRSRDPPWISGFLDLPSGQPAIAIDGGELLARLDRLRAAPRPTAPSA